MAISARSIENYQVQINAEGHTLIADEPLSVGGNDRGPNPYDLLLAQGRSLHIISQAEASETKVRSALLN